MSFSTLTLHPDLLKAVGDLGYSKPTPIQADAIPPALAGRDLLACAVTGSGKTAAFLLPILQRLLERKRGTTRALVLSPTRELAAQIVEDFHDLARYTGIRGAAVYGGVGMVPQRQAFQRGVDILVATPGRLLDHFQYSYARLDRLEVLVLDEADRMLDMGFLPDIRRILERLPERRQTLFFSATIPAPIAALARDMLQDPAAINIERESAPAAGITHAVYPVAHADKSALLLALLRGGDIRNALVFTRTKRRADRLASFLYKQGVRAAAIHGDRSQNQRTEALDGFKNGRYDVLVATDVASRGIDVDALGHVVNFDVPKVPDSYIHRVGRTARAEARGDAYTFVSPEEERDLRDIEKAIRLRLPRATLPAFPRAIEAPVPAARTDSTLQLASAEPSAPASRHSSAGNSANRWWRRRRRRA